MYVDITIDIALCIFVSGNMYMYVQTYSRDLHEHTYNPQGSCSFTDFIRY